MIGVLALQGGVAKHLFLLQQLNAPACPVRTEEDLQRCDRLIIPGGESTTMLTQIDFVGLREPLLKFFEAEKPVFGTCAGAILLSRHSGSFQQIDIDMERNGYGRQAASFYTTVTVSSRQVPAIFIRAPKITRAGKRVEVLASYRSEPVLVRQGPFLAATFHPELASDPFIHHYFIHQV